MQGYTITTEQADEYGRIKNPELVSAMQVATWRRDAEILAQARKAWKDLEESKTLGQVLQSIQGVFELLHEKRNA